MQKPAALLERFFLGQCTEKEKLKVWAYLAQHSEILDEKFNEDSWNIFEQHPALPATLSVRMFGTIEKHINRKTRIRQLIFRWTAVAAVLLISLSAWLWVIPPAGVHQEAGLVKDTTAGLQTEQFDFHINTTGKTITIPLEDGSIVKLSPLSEIRYAKSFPAVSRDIYLKGRALFKIAADRSKPFTVYAGGFGTTALGTVFRISERALGLVKIELLEGRIVIRPDSLLKNRGIIDTYLKPGQQLNFNRELCSVSIDQIKVSYPSSIKKNVPKPVFQFNNQPLANVFQTLSDTHCLKFDYAEGLLDNLNFTGAFNENKETAVDFMNTICLLNNLAMKIEKDSIHIVPITW